MTSTDPTQVERTSDRVRQLDAVDMGLAQPKGSVEEGDAGPDESFEDAAIDSSDPLLLTTIDLLDDYGGVIFSGPPGTSKSWYAENIAKTLAKGDPTLVRFVQFHPSYQYEDFVQGYVPKEPSGFVLCDKHLLDMCQVARDNSNERVMLVIDELSRGDPGRIFGEALTYLEASKRGLEFHLASGTKLSIPGNLVILATMNPQDRGVDEVDAAFERRFAKVAMEPSETLLQGFLVDAGMEEGLRTRVVAFFRTANDQRRGNQYAALGHTFFLGIVDEEGLRRLWDHQLRFLFEKAYQLDPDGLEDIRRAWENIFQGAVGPPGESGTTGDAATATGDSASGP